jgi:iron complex transport system ATP-binding protein
VIQGPQELVFWVEKALMKAGILEIKQPVLLEKEPFSLAFSTMKFDTVEDLIISLKK